MPESMPFSRTLPDLLLELAGKRPMALAARTGEREISFEELADRSRLVAAALYGSGIRRGDRVGLVLGNGITWLEILFGATMAGAVLVPFSTWSTRAELEFLIADSGIDVLFATPDFAGRSFVSDLRAFQGGKMFPKVSEYCLIAASAPAGLVTYGDFLNRSRANPASTENRPSANDDAVVLYTSGSTSRPKGVRLKHYGIIENGFNIGERQGLVGNDRVFLSSPLFWSFGGANALPAAFTHGAALIMPEKFSSESAIAMIDECACTAIYTLPAMTGAILADPSFSKEKTRSLRTGVTIGSSEDFLRAVHELGVPELCNIYGATETYGNCAVTWHDWPIQRRAHSQGTPLPHHEFRFRDTETGELLSSGAPGLVEVRGYVSPGYSGASSALNDEVFTSDGYYKTGDIGRLGPDGEFIFIGRNSEMIKRAGINVSPAEVEDILMQLRGVAEAAVVGVPDSERDERIVAYVVPVRGHAFNEGQIEDHCRATLSKYKLPDRVEIVESLPTTVTGKLQRKELKQAALELIRPQSRAVAP